MTPAISIVLPVYNGEKYLSECLQSVLRQSFPRWELWIGDDGSKDRTREIVAAVKDPRVHFEPTPSGKGLFGNLNRLLAKTRAPLVRILCQDDVLEPNGLADEIGFFDSHPTIAMAFAKNLVIDTRGEVVERAELGDLPSVLPPWLSAQQFFYHGCIPGNLSTVTMRRYAFEKLGPFDERLKIAGDYEMWARICRTYDLGVLHRHTARIRRHAEQLSSQKDSAAICMYENRKIREWLVPALPASAREAARRYEARRHDVLDFHLALVCLLQGQWRPFRRIVQGFGNARFLRAGGHWAWTLNNRRRPTAPWVLDGEA